jgi:hypothetical protein
MHFVIALMLCCSMQAQQGKEPSSKEMIDFECPCKKGKPKN